MCELQTPHHNAIRHYFSDYSTPAKRENERENQVIICTATRECRGGNVKMAPSTGSKFMDWKTWQKIKKRKKIRSTSN